MREGRQIIAMGGGGFSMEPKNPLLDNYIIASCGKSNPVVSFLPTASGDADSGIEKFYTAFNVKRCRPRHIPLFRQPTDLEKKVLESDIIYVGGGNTRNMLAIWEASGMDKLIAKAWKEGILLCGLSAGAICWFEEGHTDSTGQLGRMDCLGFLKGSCSPHYDGEIERRPSYHRFLKEGGLKPGLGLYDGVAAHFKDTEIVKIVSSRKEGRAFHVSAKDGDILEKPLETHYLGS